MLGRDAAAPAIALLAIGAFVASGSSCFFELDDVQGTAGKNPDASAGKGGSHANGGSWNGGTSNGGAAGGAGQASGGIAGAAGIGGAISGGGVSGSGGTSGNGGTGACAGKDCLGGPCVSDQCQPLLLASSDMDIRIQAPIDVVVDSSSVYFTVNEYSANQGYVMKVPINGGASTAIAQGQNFPYDIAIDSSYVYWTNSGNGVTGEGSVARVSKSGGTPTTLSSGETSPFGVSVDDNNAYFATHTSSGAIRSVPKGGGSTNNLVTGVFGAWATVCDPGTSGSVYFSADGDGKVQRVSKSGGSAVALSDFADSMRPLALDGSDLFFGTFLTNGDVQTVPKTGSATNKTLVLDIGPIAGVAADSSYVYFTIDGQTDGRVARVPRNGGPVETLASNQKKPAGISVDSQAVYWVEYNGFKIWKLAK